MRNTDLGVTVTDFMGILESINYSKFERYSNVADEISAKPSSFLEYKMLAVVPDQCDFKFLIEAAERKRWIEDSTHTQEIEIIGSWKVPKSFRSYLEFEQ